MQANRKMLFQKGRTESGRREESIMEAFIIDAAEKGSGRIAELADTAIRGRGSGILALPAAICLPIESVIRPAFRAASDGTGDEAMAALIVVREVEAAGIRGITGIRFPPRREIAANCYKICRNGFDSFGPAGIAELGRKMGRMASVVGNPYVWYVGTRDEIADAFSYLIPSLKTVLA